VSSFKLLAPSPLTIPAIENAAPLNVFSFSSTRRTDLSLVLYSSDSFENSFANMEIPLVIACLIYSFEIFIC